MVYVEAAADAPAQPQATKDSFAAVTPAIFFYWYYYRPFIFNCRKNPLSVVCARILARENERFVICLVKYIGLEAVWQWNKFKLDLIQQDFNPEESLNLVI